MEAGGLSRRAPPGSRPVYALLTSGRPDRKEGLYPGTELGSEHPRVKAGWPLHGANLWPAEVPELRAAVLDCVAACTRAAHALMEGMALSLGLDADYFRRHDTADPTVLFRIFHYPAEPQHEEERWGVGEHTDYGLLTLLAQDDNGGLQVKTPRGWVEAPPLPGTLVCNIGDMRRRHPEDRYRVDGARVACLRALRRMTRFGAPKPFADQEISR